MTSSQISRDGKVYISWHEFHGDALGLAEKLPQKTWEGMVAITRGGLVPAAIVAKVLNITLVDTVCLSSYDDGTHQQTRLNILKEISLSKMGENWIVIDDLIDTGVSIEAVRKMLPKAHFASVYAKSQGKHLIDTFVREINAWIVLPWEMDLEALKNLGRF